MIDPKEVLALPMQENDAHAATIRDYLITLLMGVWREGEGFDGKRPFGNSSWESDLFPPLVKAGILAGTLDEYGWPENYDDDLAMDIIAAAIESLN